MNEFLKIFGLAAFWSLAGAFRGTIVWPVLFAVFIIYGVHKLTKEYPEISNRVLDYLSFKW
jgi:hypothetical protein